MSVNSSQDNQKTMIAQTPKKEAMPGIAWNKIDPNKVSVKVIPKMDNRLRVWINKVGDLVLIFISGIRCVYGIGHSKDPNTGVVSDEYSLALGEKGITLDEATGKFIGGSPKVIAIYEKIDELMKSIERKCRELGFKSQWPVFSSILRPDKQGYYYIYVKLTREYVDSPADPKKKIADGYKCDFRGLSNNGQQVSLNLEQAIAVSHGAEYFVGFSVPSVFLNGGHKALQCQARVHLLCVQTNGTDPRHRSEMVPIPNQLIADLREYDAEDDVSMFLGIPTLSSEEVPNTVDGNAANEHVGEIPRLENVDADWINKMDPPIAKQEEIIKSSADEMEAAKSILVAITMAQHSTASAPSVKRPRRTLHKQTSSDTGDGFVDKEDADEKDVDEDSELDGDVDEDDDEDGDVEAKDDGTGDEDEDEL